VKRGNTHYNRSTSMFPWAVLAVSLAVTMLATAMVSHSVDEQETAQFNAAALRAHNDFKNNLSSMAALLKGMRGMFDQEHDGTPTEFRNFAYGLDFKKHFPGMKGVGYAINMTGKEESVLDQRVTDDKISDFIEHPAHLEHDFPVLYYEPSQLYGNIQGFNFGSNHVLSVALDHAITSGDMVVSPATKIGGAATTDGNEFFADTKLSFMLVPVYYNFEAVKTSAQRRRNSIGFVFAPIDAAGAIDQTSSDAIAIQVFAGGSLLYQSPAVSSLEQGYKPRNTAQLIKENIDGQEFAFYMSSTPAFDQQANRWLIPLTVIVGTMVSLLLFLFTHMEASARKRAQKEADDRKLAQRELAMSETRLRNLVEQSPLSIQVMNADGKTIEVNSGFERLWGISLLEVEDISLLDHPYVKESGLLPYLMRALSGKPTLFPPTLFDPSRLVGRGHKRWIAGSAYPLKDNQGRVREIVLMHQDLTEIKHKEEEIKRINAYLEQRVEERTEELAGTVAEMEAFSYSVAHDLRAPLRAMGSFAKILEEDHAEKLNDEAKDYLERIVENSIHMGELIDGLLDLSRISRATLAKDEVDLSTMALDIMQAIEKRQAKPWARTRVQQGLHVQADSRLIHSALENLLDNAWKFSQKSSNPLIEFGADDRGSERVYFVRDNGAGFDPSYINKLFKPFERLHTGSEFPGTGIGLATVRRIIERHGGKVWAEGSLNGGATFYFTLPPGAMKTNPPMEGDAAFDIGPTAFSASRGRLT